MAIGVNLTDNLRLELGSTKQDILNELDIAGISYDVPFEKVNKHGILESIVAIKNHNIEITTEENIVKYIKMGNSDFSKLVSIDNNSVDIMQVIRTIQEELTKKLGTQMSSTCIEKLDTKTLNITLIINLNDKNARA